MKPNSAEHQALSTANGNAAIDAALSILNTDKEAVRAAYWNRLDEKTRRMICHMAGMDPKRGEGALKTFNALDRGRIHMAARRLMRDVETILRCCQGGELPSTAPIFGHVSDGIATLKQ
jgi:hypothetical protein